MALVLPSTIRKVIWPIESSRSILRIHISTTKIYPSDKWTELIIRKVNIWAPWMLVQLVGTWAVSLDPQPSHGNIFGIDRDIICKYWKLAELPIKHGGLSLTNQTTNAKESLSWALFTAPTYCPLYAVEIRTVLLTISNAKTRLFQRQIPSTQSETIRRWLSIMPSYVSGTILS